MFLYIDASHSIILLQYFISPCVLAKSLDTPMNLCRATELNQNRHIIIVSIPLLRFSCAYKEAGTFATIDDQGIYKNILPLPSESTMGTNQLAPYSKVLLSIR